MTALMTSAVTRPRSLETSEVCDTTQCAHTVHLRDRFRLHRHRRYRRKYYCHLVAYLISYRTSFRKKLKTHFFSLIYSRNFY